MTATIQISRMSRKDKLRTMEALWADLSKEDVDIISPSWHEKALKNTSARIASGQEKIVDWAIAKHELRKRFE